MSFLSELRDAHEASHQSPPMTDIPAVPADERLLLSDRTGTRHPYAKAFTCAGVSYLISVALTMVVLYGLLPHATPAQLGDAMAGALLLFALPSIVAALLTGLIVSHAVRSWPVSKMALAFLPLFCAALALQVLG
jgi:flagellar biosynthesis protein FliQ